MKKQQKKKSSFRRLADSDNLKVLMRVANITSREKHASDALMQEFKRKPRHFWTSISLPYTCYQEHNGRRYWISLEKTGETDHYITLHMETETCTGKLVGIGYYLAKKKS